MEDLMDSHGFDPASFHGQPPAAHHPPPPAQPWMVCRGLQGFVQPPPATKHCHWPPSPTHMMPSPYTGMGMGIGIGMVVYGGGHPNTGPPPQPPSYHVPQQEVLSANERRPQFNLPPAALAATAIVSVQRDAARDIAVICHMCGASRTPAQCRNRLNERLVSTFSAAACLAGGSPVEPYIACGAPVCDTCYGRTRFARDYCGNLFSPARLEPEMMEQDPVVSQRKQKEAADQRRMLDLGNAVTSAARQTKVDGFARQRRRLSLTARRESFTTNHRGTDDDSFDDESRTAAEDDARIEAARAGAVASEAAPRRSPRRPRRSRRPTRRLRSSGLNRRRACRGGRGSRSARDRRERGADGCRSRRTRGRSRARRGGRVRGCARRGGRRHGARGRGRRAAAERRLRGGSLHTALARCSRARKPYARRSAASSCLRKLGSVRLPRHRRVVPPLSAPL